MSWLNFQPVNDIDRGREAMVYFHNKMINFSNYHFNLDQCIYAASKGKPDIFLDGLGLAINAIDMRDGQVQDAMETLATRSAGVVPSNQSAFTNALSARYQDISAADWGYALPGIAGETAVDVAKGAQAVGDAVIDTGKSLLVVGPILVLGIVIFLGYSFAKNPGKTMRSFAI